MLHETPRKSNKKYLSTFSIAMLSLGSVLSLRSLPFLAHHGLAIIFYYGMAVTFFMIPYAVIAADLVSIFPGGVFVWVKEAFGPRLGFFSIWLQWFHSIPWYPAVLSFFAISIARMVFPELSTNKFFVWFVILIMFWGLTFINFLHLSFSSYLSTICLFIGTIIPGALLIGMAIIWLIKGNPSFISFSSKEILPQSKGLMGSIAMISAAFLTFTGLETNANLILDMKNPKKNYPIALFIAAGLLFFFLVTGTLSIAMVIPKNEINLITALIDALGTLLTCTGQTWPLKILSIAILFGIIGQLNVWLSGPARGLWHSANYGCLHPIFTKVNINNSPVVILIFQAILVSIVASCFLFISNFNFAYWILSLFCTQLTLTMYIVMIFAAIVLHHRYPEKKRKDGLLKTKFSIWTVSLTGLISIFYTFGVGFIPPTALVPQNLRFTYALAIIGGFLACISLPFLVYYNKKK
ncbi:putative transporter [Candidatus Clavichlamydia salmonicola]|uniref:APC family permease n=1 Tax=Candidatus Clavichlamydia salmonicola TaxID=469812 RepID=UPI001891263F|nr:APC family permease [Candidatus Clavichlamydia salmonicola]MBF5050773.1 putative transporter [Candidatus Clavichlamydia salmonicola]